MSGYTIAASSELMENYIQADVLLPQDKFVALQTDAGASLLFSLGTGGTFNLTVEAPGQTHGWRQVDLGGALIAGAFGGKASVKAFGAAQAAATGGAGARIHLAVVVGDDTGDHLYLSLGNSESDLGWTAAPAWTAAPFDAVDGAGQPIDPPSPLRIADVLISEAGDAEYVVVDILRDPTQPVGFLSRYYLDPAADAAPKWRPHDLAVDIQAKDYVSRLGRAAHAFGVDGLYTKGTVGTSGQLVYTPLYNVFDPSLPALPSRLNLPGGLVADAIAVARNPDGASDLYVAAAGGLYWFASDNQKDQAQGVPVAAHPLLSAVRALHAYAAQDAVTVWGLNGDDTVFYLTCPLGRQAQAAAWSAPLPILTGVDAISPFVDRAYSANTFFAHTGDGLAKLVKSPTTGLWARRPITLPPRDTTQASAAIHSYTTHLQVTDADGRPARNLAVRLTATNVTSVYINHLYYLVGPSPVDVLTDAQGAVTIVETTTSLAGTRFLASVDGQPDLAINTLDAAWARNAQYTTADSLRSAQIVDRQGNSRAFIPAGTSKGDLDRVAYSNQCLAKAYAKVAAAPFPQARPAALAPPPSRTAALAAAGIGEGMAVDVGDLFGWLESGVEAAIQLVEDASDGAWLFVATIGEAVYHGVLDGVEAVVAAATWIYHAIKVAVEDVILFLQFLFEWQDILVTHRVLKNVLLRLAQAAVSEIETFKADLQPLFQRMRSALDGWADIPDFEQSAGATLASNPPVAGLNSAPANLGVHHFKGGCASSSSDLSPATPAEAILQDLIHLMEAEGETLAAAVDAIRTDILEQFSSLSLTDILKRLVAIFTDTLLQSAENVLVTMLDVLAQLAAGVVDTLAHRLHIPVLSWLYKELTGDDLSFLDLVCLVAAIPVTLVYKAAARRAPFPRHDAFTQGLIAAGDLDAIKAQFVAAPHPGPKAAAPVLDQDKLKIFAFATGVGSLFGGIVLVTVGNIQRFAFDEDAPPGLPYLATLATIAALGNFTYVSPNIASIINTSTDNAAADLNNILTVLSLLKSMVAIRYAASVPAGEVFAFLETFLNIAWNLPVIANLLQNHGAFDTTYKSLLPETVGNLAFNTGGILELPIAIAEDIKVKAALAATQAALMLTYGGLMVAAASIYLFAPGQEH
ncbi:hypothetical protein [Caulobacter sp. UNC358MFTsu5.1]|uniref:hypothetical protein n=1 Tax=Caulobacter sp. UNC358MFTsu5.1 TaxID=1449049 RepID=UPI00068F6233|nr:hypothetical protein [Caulobacter sp. UNC358MFTsu5.1]